MDDATPDPRLPSQPQGTATGPWPVLISRPAERRGLSYAGYIRKWCVYSVPANVHPSQY